MTSADPAWRERAPADGIATGLAEQVRVRVRDSGVDPQRDTAAVRRIAESIAQAHDERSLTGAVAPLDDLPALVDDLVARVAGFGPLQRYLDDPSVEEVWINDPSRVFIARQGRHELTPTILTGEEVRELVERMLKTSGRRLDLSQPFVDALLPGGHRLHVVLEGISRDFAAVKTAVKKTTASIRRHGIETYGPESARDLRAHQPGQNRTGAGSPAPDRGMPRTLQRPRLGWAQGLLGQRHLRSLREAATWIRAAARRY
jgi:pilus assembly protein CpaF